MQVLKLTIIAGLVLFLTSCYKEQLTNKRPGLDDWTRASHGNVSPNYKKVFDDSRVAKMLVKLTPDNWTKMQNDMTTLSGPFGGGGGGFGGPEPVWVESSVFYDDMEWYHVGVRYKGAGSLQSGWGMGNNKLPFRLHFDRFEDLYPVMKNQRFYGFRQFALSSGFKDMSLIREKVVTDMFNDFSVPAARGTFVRLYLDHGNGEKYLGLYTLTEIAQESFLSNHFSNTTGNLYKPETNFLEGSFDQMAFPNKTNEVGGDWNDIKELFSVLHSPLRTSDHAKWKKNLETVFDVDLFLKFLAVTVAIENPDVYGNDGHNFYLYHNPADGLIKWIPWDHNEALLAIGGPQGGELPLAINTVNDNWLYRC